MDENRRSYLHDFRDFHNLRNLCNLHNLHNLRNLCNLHNLHNLRNRHNSRHTFHLVPLQLNRERVWVRCCGGWSGLYVARNTYIRVGIVEWTVKNPVHIVRPPPHHHRNECRVYTHLYALPWIFTSLASVWS